MITYIYAAKSFQKTQKKNLHANHEDIKDNFSFALKILQNITCTYLISLQNLTFCVNNDNNEYNPIIE